MSQLSIKVGSIWKANRTMRKIKRISDNFDYPQTISRFFAYRRGHGQTDFFILVPDNHIIYRPKPTNNIA